MTLWSEYRTAIREGILKDAYISDDPTKNDWSNDDLLRYLKWSFDVFASHTSYYADETIVSTDTGQDFQNKTITLANVADEQWWSNAKVTIGTKSIERHYLASSGASFVFDSDVTLATSDTVRVRYFAFYPAPVLDDDVLSIPRWAEPAIVHLVAYYALIQKAIDFAEVNQWKSKRDSGQPEHNAMRRQQEYLYAQYHSLIGLRSVQDRDQVMSR